jgi:cbb3-type cytochrome oxidase subunit 3
MMPEAARWLLVVLYILVFLAGILVMLWDGESHE